MTILAEHTSPSVLKGQSFLCFVGDDYEDLELWYPKHRLIEAGATFVVAGQDPGRRYVGKNGYPCVPDTEIQGINTSKFHGLICAGGWMPDKLRRDPEVLRITQEFAAAGKLVAAICHGGWMLADAGCLRGRTMTSWPAIRKDLERAGAIWKDTAAFFRSASARVSEKRRSRVVGRWSAPICENAVGASGQFVDRAS